MSNTVASSAPASELKRRGGTAAPPAYPDRWTRNPAMDDEKLGKVSIGFLRTAKKLQNKGQGQQGHVHGWRHDGRGSSLRGASGSRGTLAHGVKLGRVPRGRKMD